MHIWHVYYQRHCNHLQCLLNEVEMTLSFRQTFTNLLFQKGQIINKTILQSFRKAKVVKMALSWF